MSNPIFIAVIIASLANLLIFVHNTLWRRRLEKSEFFVHLASVDLHDCAGLIGYVGDTDLAERIYAHVNNAQDNLAQVRL